MVVSRASTLETTQAPLAFLTTAVLAARSTSFESEAKFAGKPLPPIRRASSTPRPLHIVYLMPRTDVGGGARGLLEHANHLTRLGLRVTVVANGDRPRWVPVICRFIGVPFGEPLYDAIPPCDLIVAGYWEQVHPARRRAIAPVVHFEQGDFHLYDAVPPSIKGIIESYLWAADDTMTVGKAAQRALRDRYGVDALRVSNAVDLSRFKANPNRSLTGQTVLFVGWDGAEFKGISDARRVASILTGADPKLRIRWVTPQPPLGPGFGEVFVNPDQEELAKLYQEADIYVCTSRYESFPLPPLEAMASGTAVVSTSNDGIMAYANHGENCLLAPVGDVQAIATAIRRVLDDPTLADRLRSNGLRTARDLSWPKIIRGVASHFRSVVRTHNYEQPITSFDLEIDRLRFNRTDALQGLWSRLSSCETNDVAIPVSRPAALGHQSVRWEIVARRLDGTPGVTKIYLPASSTGRLRDAPYQDGLELLRNCRFDDALIYFVGFCQAHTDDDLISCGRWLILTLLELDRVVDALNTALAFLRDHPSHPDFLYLSARAFEAQRDSSRTPAYLEALRLIGHGSRFSEWFESPDELLRLRCTA